MPNKIPQGKYIVKIGALPCEPWFDPYSESAVQSSPCIHVTAMLPFIGNKSILEDNDECDCAVLSFDYPQSEKDNIAKVAQDVAKKAKIRHFVLPVSADYTVIWNVDYVCDISVQDESTDDEPYAYVYVSGYDGIETISEPTTIDKAIELFNDIAKQVKKYNVFVEDEEYYLVNYDLQGSDN